MDNNMRYAEGLAAMIKVPTVSNCGDELFLELRRVMSELFPKVFAAATMTVIEGNSLLFRIKGQASDKPVVLMGHQDVVPAGEGWTHEPFGGEIKDGKIWGRGTMDCKGTVYSEFQAVEELLSEGYVFKQDVYLACSDCEEVFGHGAQATADYLAAQKVKPFIVLDEGGVVLDEPFKGMDKPYCVIGVYEKGYADVKFTAKGAGGHSSTPPKNTPIARLAAFVNEVEHKVNFDKKLDNVAEAMLTAFAPSLKGALGFILGNLKIFKPLLVKVLPKFSGYGNALLGTSLVFTQQGGAEAPNVIPTEAYVIANIRHSLHQNSASTFAILEKIAKKHNVEMTVLNSREASPAVDINGEGFKYVYQCCRDFFPQYGAAPYIIMGGTDCRYYQGVCDNAMRFTPLFLTSKQLAAMHAMDENVNIDSVAGAVGFYKHFLSNLK